MKLIVISLLLASSCLQANSIEERVQQAIQLAQSNNKIAAKDLLSSTLDEKISEEDRAVILYNLASLSLQEDNLAEAESLFRQLTLLKTGPELSYCININYAITLLLHAKRDLQEYSETALATVKKRILLAKVYIKKAQKPDDTQITSTLNLLAETLLKKANQNELYERLKSCSISDAASVFSSALQPFIDGLLYLPTGSKSQFIQTQADLLDAILFFYCKAIADQRKIKETKEIEVVSNSLYMKTKSLEPGEVLQQLLFLQFLLRQLGTSDPILEAISSYYESSIFSAPQWRKQQQKRKDYIISLVKQTKQHSSYILINAINTLSPQDLLTYYNLSLLDPNTLFISLIEKEGNPPITLLALQDKLSSSLNPGAKAALAILSSNKSLIDAFALLDFPKAIDYITKKIVEDPNNIEVKKKLLHLFQTIKPNTLAILWCETLILASNKDPIVHTALAWLTYFASETTNKEKQLYQAITNSISYTNTIASKIEVKWQNSPQMDPIKLMQPILLIDSSTETALRELDLISRAKNTTVAIEDLIEQYKELIQNKSLPIENHILLLNKVKSILDKLRSFETSSDMQKNSDKEPHAVQDATNEQKQAVNSALMEKAIGIIQEMQKQDAPFDEKKPLGIIPSQVKRPW